MRIVVYGVGAIGGTVAAALTLAGYEVAGIARGKMLEAIRQDGLRLRTPTLDQHVRFPVFADPSELTWRADDAVLLTMKGQDTAKALDALRAAGVADQPIFCLQNGIDNERMASRLFPNVYAVTVMLPADYTTPGEVVCHGAPKRGMFDIGRFPEGLDQTAEQMAAVFEAGEFKTFLLDDVMRSKRGKLLENLGNVLDAALGPGQDREPFYGQARAEGEAVFRAMGLDWIEIGSKDPRREGVLGIGHVAGVTRAGSSSTQSLQRGAGSIETDYLNGEIVLLGRLHSVPTPVNRYLTQLSHRMVAESIAPGSISPEEIAEGCATA